MSISLTLTDEDMIDMSLMEEGEEEDTTDKSPLEKPKEQETTQAEETKLTSQVTLFDVFDIPQDIDINKKWYKDTRLNVLHVQGVNDMSTEDVMAYFKEYCPASIEWINDTSCNVVFDDFTSSAKALVGMTTHLLVDEEDLATTSASPIPVMKISDLETKVPEGFKFVLAKPSEKANILLLRLATSSDKKKPRAGKFSEYYRKYGNPHYGGKKNIMSSSLAEKMKMMAAESGADLDMEEDAPTPEEPPIPQKPLGLRMKMRADEEEEKQKSPRKTSPRKSIWERLDTSGRESSSRPSVLDRLGRKSHTITRTNREKASGGLSVWSRLALDSDSSNQKTESSSSNRTVIHTNIRRVR